MSMEIEKSIAQKMIIKNKTKKKKKKMHYAAITVRIKIK